MKTCVINQPAGLGDIFFTQKIAHLLDALEYEVFWPVNPEIVWVKDYIVGPVKFCSIDDDFPEKQYYLNSIILVDGPLFKYLPLKIANIVYPSEPIMNSKYTLAKVKWEDWAHYFNFERKEEKENALYYDVLGLKDGEEYTFLNENYGTQPNYLKFSGIQPKGDKIIEMGFLEGFTVFDWCKVLENASAIYMVDSSLNYIMEKIPIKTKNLYVYPRHKEFTIKQIKHLFTLPWEYVIV